AARRSVADHAQVHPAERPQGPHGAAPDRRLMGPGRSARRGLRLATILLAVTLSSVASAQGFDPATVPEALRPWIPWVRAGDPGADCPFLYGGGARRCAWPGGLALDVDGDGARFAQRWEVAGAGAWVPLPGDAALWPRDVRAGDRALAVVPAPAGSPAPGGPSVWL